MSPAFDGGTMPTTTGVLDAFASLLPALPPELRGALSVLVLVGFAYVFALGGLRFGNGRVEVLGHEATSRETLVGFLAAAVLLGTAHQWVPYVFVLSGWQAFGLVCAQTGWLLNSTADGPVDYWAVVLTVAGLVLLVVPWLV